MVKKQKETRNIGVNVNPPKESCDDKHCPFHGNLPVRGRTFTGVVVQSKTPKMATVEWERRVMVPKYERYKKKRTKLVVHNPMCINAKLGDIVKIIESRPISKMKKFVIIENLGKEELIADILEAREHVESKKKDKKEENKEAPKAKE
ncbi:30S ribosomal protein S17 [Candidatus Woesearchaeota archaeon CG11_big_fil_rev_8_21_14_0_20_43_8]|nr:MAG: 30S ribosomal protein S17 [Candidatus Woesearchaeota archaeon CG11_big_fil_rev_8_21_14_0_20_43_8]